MQLIVTGSLAFDQIMVFPDAFINHIMPEKLHTLSVSFLVDKLHKNFGGTSGNICYSLGLLGQSPICLSSAGKDAIEYKKKLQKAGVNTTYIQMVMDDYTGSFVVITDKQDCQIAGFYPGAMAKDTDLDLESVIARDGGNAQDYYAVISPTMPQAMANHVKTAKRLGLRYMYSPAQQIHRIETEDLVAGMEGADIVIGTDYEIALLEKRTGLTTQAIAQKAHIVITTMGENGSRIEQQNKAQIMIGVVKPKAVLDPTGSGDGYTAGFLTAYLEGKSLVECGQWGATAATYVLEEFGTTAHSFTRATFESRVEASFS